MKPIYYAERSIKILVELIHAKGITDVVVCPGSRNIPIIRQLNHCPSIKCHAVTDERSAGFYALGIALVTRKAVVVCVTSGSALLNLAPAVSEAYYRKLPIVVISADRQPQWIDRLDGQTIRQVDSLEAIVKMSVNLPQFEKKNTERCNYCNLLINKALNIAVSDGSGPVHINVPIGNPLLDSDATLCLSRNITFLCPSSMKCQCYHELFERFFLAAKHPMIVIGQLNHDNRSLLQALKVLSKHCVVLSEPLSYASVALKYALPKLYELTDGCGIDFMFYVGGSLVNKETRQILRDWNVGEVFEVDEDGEIHDTFMHQTGVLKVNPSDFLMSISGYAQHLEGSSVYSLTDNRSQWIGKWRAACNFVGAVIDNYIPAYSQMFAVREFELSIEDMNYASDVHYANSMEIRLACIYARHFVYNNRGVNGIDGTISTAAGHSLMTDDMVFCVTGDLSFFYDQNALWNNELRGNFRILLLNNGGGVIFSRLKGVRSSDSIYGRISGTHMASARGVCEQYDIGYLSAYDEAGYRLALASFLTVETKRPIVLEVFTNQSADNEAFDKFEYRLQNNILD